MLLMRLFALVVPLLLVGSSQGAWTLKNEGFAADSRQVNNYLAGAFSWSLQSGDPSALPLVAPNSPTSIFTFCIDIDGHLYLNSPQVFSAIDTNFSNTFVNGHFDAIQSLFNNNESFLTKLTAGDASSTESAAFQLAIWQILFGVNNFNAASDVLNQAQIFRDNETPSPTTTYTLYAFHAFPDSSQEQIGWLPAVSVGGTGGNDPVPTPAPPALLLALVGAVGMGGFSRLRSRFSR